MTRSAPGIRGYRTTLTIVGSIYALMGASWVVRGPSVLLDFGVSEQLIAEPVVEDFFLFFYELMAFVGVLTVLCAWVARDRRSQGLVGLVFCTANVYFALRDLKTSDSDLGNSLYKGEETLVFVVIDVSLALIFGYFAAQGLRRDRSSE